MGAATGAAGGSHACDIRRGGGGDRHHRAFGIKLYSGSHGRSDLLHRLRRAGKRLFRQSTWLSAGSAREAWSPVQTGMCACMQAPGAGTIGAGHMHHRAVVAPPPPLHPRNSYALGTVSIWDLI